MQPNPLADKSFIDAVTRIEEQLDNVVDHGSDDDLFVASYLQGHFAVISRPLEMEQGATVELLDAKLTENLQNAFANNELEPEDQQKVTALWQDLVAGAR